MTGINSGGAANGQAHAVQVSGLVGGTAFVGSYAGHSLMKRDMLEHPAGKLAQKFPIGFSKVGVLRGAAGPGLMMATVGLGVGEVHASGVMPDSKWKYGVAAGAGAVICGALTLCNPIFHGRQLAGEAGKVLAKGGERAFTETVKLNIRAGAHSVPINMALGTAVGAGAEFAYAHTGSH